MAITPSDFSKIWASNADTPEYTFTEADYLKGWDFVGNLPPTRAQWNAIQKSTDEKMKYVFDNFGAPLTASTVADMTMQNRVYVYTGSETGYTAGHWYYWDGSAWADGGVYNSNTVQIDPTLTISGAAADAKVVGVFKKTLNLSPVPITIVEKAYINITNGGILSNDSFNYIKFRVIPGLKIYYLYNSPYSSQGLLFYTSDKISSATVCKDNSGNYIGGKGSDTGTEYTAPADAQYCCASYSSRGDANNVVQICYPLEQDIKNADIFNNVSKMEDSLIADNQYNLLNNVAWSRGSIDSSTGEDSSSLVRIRTPFIKFSERFLLFELDSNYYFSVCCYDNAKTYIGFININRNGKGTANILPNTRFIRFVIKEKSNATIDTTISYVLKVFVNSYLGFVKQDISEGLLKLGGITLNTDWWEYGSVTSVGSLLQNNTRIRTTYLPISGIKRISMEILSGYEFAIHVYDKELNQIYYTNYIQQSFDYINESNGSYIIFLIRKSDDSTASLSWSEHLNVVFYNNLAYIASSLGGTGSNAYYGEDVVLTETRQKLCTIEKWLAVTSETIPTFQNYNFFRTQSVEIYGGYIFLFFNGVGDIGSGVVLDFNTKEIVGSFTEPGYNYNHNNSAQFTDIFYDDADEFPLIAISRCGNSGGTQSDKDQCLFYRIVRDGNTFTFIFVNKIQCTTRTYGSSWGIDVGNNTITMVGYHGGSYQVTTNNPIYFYTWKMPSKMDILSGNEIIFDVSDAVSQCQLPFGIFQALHCYHDTSYIVLKRPGKPTFQVSAVDVSRGLEKSTIPLIERSEGEGITVYNGKMYVLHRLGKDITESNPVNIYSISFN